jgi:hypothetical protein
MDPIGATSTITLAAAGSIVMTVTASTLWVTRNLHLLRIKIAVLEHDRYTLAMAAEQALRMALNNPGFKVPDPRNLGELLCVRTSHQRNHETMGSDGS